MWKLVRAVVLAAHTDMRRAPFCGACFLAFPAHRQMVAGMNPMNPPCLAGKKVLKFYIVTDRKGTAGGAPDAVAMER